MPPLDAATEAEILQARLAALELRAAELSRAEQASRALAEIGRELAGTLDLDQTTRRIVDIVGEFFGRPTRLLSSLRQALDPASVAVKAAPAAPPASTAPTAPARSLRVLVAEDNAVNQIVVMRMLEKAGHHADLAANGREAVEALARGAYDLVLMDCQMPEMDGFAACRAIRADEAGTGRHVPIVALTANATQGDREQCLAAGMDDYLAKPITAATLRAVLTRWGA